MPGAPSLLKFVSPQPSTVLPGQLLWLRVPDAQKAILGFVAGHASRDGLGRPATGFFPISMGELRAFVGLSERPLQVHLDQLEKEGYLERVIRGGRGQVNLYRLRWWAQGERHTYFGGFSPLEDEEAVRIPTSLLVESVKDLSPELRVAWWQVLEQTSKASALNSGDQDGFAVPDLGVMAAQSGVTPRTVRSRMGDLVQRGLLEVNPLGEGVRVPWSQEAPAQNAPQGAEILEMAAVLAVRERRAESARRGAPNSGVSTGGVLPSPTLRSGDSGKAREHGGAIPGSGTPPAQSRLAARGPENKTEGPSGVAPKVRAAAPAQSSVGEGPASSTAPPPAPSSGVSTPAGAGLPPMVAEAFRNQGWLGGEPVLPAAILLMLHDIVPSIQPDPARPLVSGTYPDALSERQAAKIASLQHWSLEGLRTLARVLAEGHERGQLRRPMMGLFTSAATNLGHGRVWLERLVGRSCSAGDAVQGVAVSPETARAVAETAWREALLKHERSRSDTYLRKVEADTRRVLVDLVLPDLPADTRASIEAEALAHPSLLSYTAEGPAWRKAVASIRDGLVLKTARIIQD